MSSWSVRRAASPPWWARIGQQLDGVLPPTAGTEARWETSYKNEEVGQIIGWSLEKYGLVVSCCQHQKKTHSYWIGSGQKMARSMKFPWQMEPDNQREKGCCTMHCCNVEDGIIFTWHLVVLWRKITGRGNVCFDFFVWATSQLFCKTRRSSDWDSASPTGDSMLSVTFRWQSSVPWRLHCYKQLAQPDLCHGFGHTQLSFGQHTLSNSTRH